MLDSLPARVTVYEVGPRDGLQNERAQLSVEEKLELVGSLCGTGLTRIEATSFVSPKWIPQLADADQVARRLPRQPTITFSAGLLALTI